MVSTDRDALAALYNATDGANWTRSKNWKTEAPLSQWHGVNVDDQGRVTKLQLNLNNLKGPIPPELGNLAALQHVDLEDNELSGHIPPELGKLGALQHLELWNNTLSGPILRELGNLVALQYLNLGLNELSGHIPPQLGQLGVLMTLDLSMNKLDGTVPKELANLRYMHTLLVGGNNLESPLPPMSYGIDMRDWGGIPTEDDKLRARAATGVKHPGTEQPVIVKSLAFLIDLWHVIVPVVDEVTDVLLLTSTADPASALWWICLITLVVADIERLWLLFTLCLTMVLSPFLWCFALASYSNLGRTAPRFFALMNCRNSAPQGTFRGRLADSFLWVLVGSRSRCSPLWRMVGMSLDAKVDEADHAGVAFGVIDKWVARHPFSLVGKVLFGARFALKGGNEGESRRAGVMIRAVGETLVVDSLFLALSVVSEEWDGNLTGVAGFSALFSILELLTELQYYVAEAGKVLEPVKSSGTTATAGARSEQDVVSDPSTIGVAANV